MASSIWQAECSRCFAKKIEYLSIVISELVSVFSVTRMAKLLTICLYIVVFLSKSGVCY